MFKYTKKLNAFLHKWPGEKYFGIYRFLPLFFFFGAALEFAMIHWRPNGVNFYDVYKKKAVQEEALKRYNSWIEINKSIQ